MNLNYRPLVAPSAAAAAAIPSIDVAKILHGVEHARRAQASKLEQTRLMLLYDLGKALKE